MSCALSIRCGTTRAHSAVGNEEAGAAAGPNEPKPKPKPKPEPQPQPQPDRCAFPTPPLMRVACASASASDTARPSSFLRTHPHVHRRATLYYLTYLSTDGSPRAAQQQRSRSPCGWRERRRRWRRARTQYFAARTKVNTYRTSKQRTRKDRVAKMDKASRDLHPSI